MDKLIDDSNKTMIGEQRNNPTLEQGNYIIEVISDDKLIRRIIISDGSINIIKLQDGGLALDIL